MQRRAPFFSVVKDFLPHLLPRFPHNFSSYIHPIQAAHDLQKFDEAGRGRRRGFPTTQNRVREDHTQFLHFNILKYKHFCGAEGWKAGGVWFS